MGVTSSQPVKKLTKEQEDVRYLGDRMPFGDEELVQLYRTYNNIEKLPNRVSFLSDWGVQSLITIRNRQREQLQREQQRQGISPAAAVTHNEQDEDKKGEEERLLLIQILESKILSPNFGNHLYKCVFIEKGSVSPYDGNIQQQHQEKASGGGNPNDSDELAKLERFFHGISNCGRRGNRNAVNALLDCCENVTHDTASTNPGAYTNNNSNPVLISAAEFVQIGYKIALSCAFLESANRDDGDISVYISPSSASGNKDGEAEPPASIKKQHRQHIVLKAVTDSLVAFSNDRRIRLGLPSLENPDALVTKNDVLEWTDEVAPLFGSILSTFTYRVFFPDKKYPPSRTPFDYPRIPNESAFFDNPSSPLLFALGTLSSSLGGTFFRLYTSLSDGLSFNRLLNALYGYSGPTLLVIREVDSGGIFGAFTSSPWKENKDFYGTSDCFLFQLMPKFAVYRPSGNASNFMYCNSEARSRGYDGQAHGIGFGGTVQEPRLFISETFDDCVASNRDVTYQNGPLLPSAGNDNSMISLRSGISKKHFDIESLEVWGVGGEAIVEEALSKRSKARDIKDATIRKAKKVDKAAFLEDFRSGVIDSKQFDYLKQIQGRADCDLEELRSKQSHDREASNVIK